LRGQASAGIARGGTHFGSIFLCRRSRGAGAPLAILTIGFDLSFRSHGFAPLSFSNVAPISIRIKALEQTTLPTKSWRQRRLFEA